MQSTECYPQEILLYADACDTCHAVTAYISKVKKNIFGNLIQAHSM